MRIIRASSEHIEVVAALFDQYRQFYRQPSEPAKAREFIAARIEKDESVIYLAVEDGGDVRALGFIQLYPAFSSVSIKRLWILNDLYVSSGARKRGVARALMERARQLAVETGAKGLVLQTAADNHPAQALYESLGYKRDEEFYGYFLSV